MGRKGESHGCTTDIEEQVRYIGNRRALACVSVDHGCDDDGRQNTSNNRRWWWLFYSISSTLGNFVTLSAVPSYRPLRPQKADCWTNKER